MGAKCIKCGMPRDTSSFTEKHYNRHHCRIHNKDDSLLCNDCDGEHGGGCYHKFKFHFLCLKFN